MNKLHQTIKTKMVFNRPALLYYGVNCFDKRYLLFSLIRAMELITIPLSFAFISPVHLLPQEALLIRQLNEEFNFDHNIILLDSTLNRPDHYIHLPSSPSHKSGCVPQTIYTFHNSSDVKILTNLNQTTSKSTLLVIAVESLLYVEYESKLLAELRNFFTFNMTSMDPIDRLFEWSWSAGIVNILSAFYATEGQQKAELLNVFQFDPFWPLKMKNVTGSESVQNYFSDNFPNYHKHPLQFVTTNAIKRTQLERDFWNFVTVAFNASELHTEVSLKEYENISLTEMSEDIVKHEVDIDDVIQTYPVYPHRKINIVLMVPHALPYASIVEYLKNSTWERIFLYLFITVTVASLLLTVSFYLRTKTVGFLQCVAIVCNLLLNDNGAIRYNLLSRADLFLLAPLTFAGLIVMNGVFSVYQSYMTLPIYERQIKTIDDLFESSVPILVNEMFWADAFIKILEDRSQHDGWNEKVVRLSLDEIQREFDNFNSSVAIPCPDILAHASIEVQKRLELKAYYSSNELILVQYYVTFMIRSNFPFMEPLNNIIHRMHSSGLIDKWMGKENEDSIKNLYAATEHRLKRFDETQLYEFSIPSVIWFGWLCSVIIFVCEFISNKVKLIIQQVILYSSSKMCVERITLFHRR